MNQSKQIPYGFCRAVVPNTSAAICPPRVHPQPAAKRSFTIIELLVVIAIIMILTAMLLPVAGQARARAKMTNCSAQLHQAGMAMLSYRSDYDRLMPPWISALSPDYLGGEEVLICPQDPSRGHDGGRSGGVGDEWNYVPPTWDETKDGPWDSFPETDDTAFNQNPALDTPEERRELGANPDVERCSYMYEFCNIELSWYGCTTELGLPATTTWWRFKQEQLRRGLGRDPDPMNFCQDQRAWEPELFPALRCFHHYSVVWRKNELVLNAGYSGDFFLSKLTWEDGVYQ